MGCSPSKDLPLVIVPSIAARETVTIPMDITHPHREIRRFENSILIYISTISPISIQKNIIKQLHYIFSILKTFTNFDECVTFIENIRNEAIFLIISSEMATCLKRLPHLPQLEKIYIFQMSSDETKVENDYNEQPNVFYTIADLCEQLHRDVEECEHDLIAVTAINTETADILSPPTPTSQTAFFLCTQLVKKIALRLKFENEHKTEFLEFCREQYADDIEQLQAIDNFEDNYRPQKALYWLTNFCFVSRVLRRVLRTQEIDIIYKMGFFIKHVHMQLSILHEKITSLRQNPFSMYRGKSMSKAKFDILLKNNRNGLFMFSNFLIANTNKNIAIDFIHRRIETHPERIGVLFEIHINPIIPNTMNPFALLNNLNPDNKSASGEIYFTMGTTFRIESLEQVSHSSAVIWNVRLSLIDDNDEQFHRIVAPLWTNEVESNPLAYLGKLLIEMGESHRAAQFYLGLLNDPSVVNQPRRLVRLHNGIGTIFMQQGEYSSALEHYQISLTTSMSYLPPDHPDLAPIYHTIGDSYFKRADYSQALYNYERAVQLAKYSLQTPDQHFLDDLYSCVVRTKELLKIGV